MDLESERRRRDVEVGMAVVVEPETYSPVCPVRGVIAKEIRNVFGDLVPGKGALW
jgi:hypothetical protein